MATTSIVSTTGLAGIASRIKDATTPAFTYMAVGVSTTAPTLADTTLGSEITIAGQSRAAVPAGSITFPSSGQIQWKNTFNFTTVFAVTELGIFNSLMGGTMLCRSVWTSPTNVESGTSVEFTALLTLSNGA